MQLSSQYRIEFFSNSIDENDVHYLEYIHHDFIDDFLIDDDYLAIQTTSVEIRPTEKVNAGHLARVLRNEDTYFFGVVTNVAPTDYTTKVTIAPFISIFDEPILFDSAEQAQNTEEYSLENVLAAYIVANYSVNSDALQNYPISIVVPDEGEHTNKWDMNIGVDFLREDGEESQKVVTNLYETLIVGALKVYGVAINPTVDFATGQITLTIGTIAGEKMIDADLDNVKVVTLKVNDRPKGVNKLVVYNSEDYSVEPYCFYVHPDRSYDDVDEDRILPVSVNIVTVTPDVAEDEEDEEAIEDAFYEAALEAAYDNLSGLEWDDLIELQCAANDVLVNPMGIKIGQQVTIYYKGNVYSSILTGRTVTRDNVKLIFGSERIQMTKKRTSRRERR